MPKQLRNFCFTINNPTSHSFKQLENLYEISRYMIYGKEVGDSGTPHLQGYCELEKRKTWSVIKKIIPTAHIEARRGTATQASDYCKKEGKYIEQGEISRQGKRTDLAELYNMTAQGHSDIQLGENLPVQYMKYYKAVDRVRFNYAQLDNKFEKIEVLVFVGAAGSGKTRKAYSIDENLYNVAIGPPLWWDGYHGQETILLDDFYGEINYGKLLKLLDGYKFQLPVKGGFTWKQWKRVIITSNLHPRHWYEDRGLTEALKRRITSYETFEETSDG